MTSVKQGITYTADRVRSGDSSRGPWELIVVKDEHGRNPTSLFVENMPSGVREGGQFQVKDITEVRIGNKRNSKGIWEPTTTIVAIVEAIRSEFDDLSADDNPWDTGVPNDTSTPWDDFSDDALPL